jgi:succinate dehydrogenase / fumarate reductase iron-sulfur subunit
VLAMLKEMDNCGFGNGSNHRACEKACPKEVSISHIARFNREFLKAALFAKMDM